MARVEKRGESFRITVSLGYDENYHQIRKTTTYKPPIGTAPQKARKLAEEQAVLFEQRVKGLPSYGENMTFSQLCDWFFSTIAPNKIRERTQDNYQRYLRCHVFPTFRNTKLKDMTAARLDNLFAELSKSGGVVEMVTVKEDSPLPDLIKNKMVKTAKEMNVSDVALRKAARGEEIRADIAAKIAGHFNMTTAQLFNTASADKPLAASCVYGVVTCLSSIFQSAYKAGIMKENPIRRTTPPRRQGKATEGIFLDEEQSRLFLSLLDDMPQSTYKAAFFVLLYVGLRSGELRALHWNDIDMDGGIMYIRHGLYEKSGAYHRTLPKNNSSIRALKMPQDVIDVLTEYKIWQDEQITARGTLWHDGGIVFPNTRGKYLDGQSFNKKLKQVIAGHGLPDIHIHSLRHTTASLLINNHETAATVAAQLGHGSIDTTNRVYVHSFKAAQAAAAVGLQTLLRRTAATFKEEYAAM
jgi:integrase